MDYVKIKQTGVLCGLYQKRVEPGYVLENGTVLLESEKDEQGRYIGGAGMDGMYLATAERYSPAYSATGEIMAFQRMDSGSIAKSA